VALLGLLGALLLLWFVRFLLRRRRVGVRSPVRTLEAALEVARESGEPLSLITVVFLAGGAAARELAPVLRSRLRHADRLCQLNPGRFLVVAPDTDPDAAEVLVADVLRHVERAGNGSGALAIEVHWSDGDANAAELLQRVTESNGGAHVPTPTG
jgi:GGDEF domain-containing protein